MKFKMLKPIVIDGSNVALSHGNNVVFSCKGIRICVDWFRSRGHKDIKAFVPSWRKESTRSKSPIKDQDILFELEREDFLVFTPSRWICGKRIICYDDRYILKFAADIDGIVVSNDSYRDLITECQEFKRVVVERVLMYSFINDRFMPPDDPLGRNGPSLEDFLRRENRCEDSLPICPYGKKCTYGHKCKYRHINNDYNMNITNHNALRKTVSAPPYLDNQQVCKSKTKTNSSEPHYFAWMPEFHKSNCEQKETLEGLNGYNVSPCQAMVASEDRNAYNDRSLSQSTPTARISDKDAFLHADPTSHKKLTAASSAPVVLPKHKKLTRLSSTPSKPNFVPDSSGLKEVNFTEKRQQLFFHLSNVFPKEHVESVFRIFPNETNPNLLCDALIKLNISNT